MKSFYIISYSLFLLFFVIEIFTRQGKNSKDMDKTKYDKGSTSVLSVTMAITIILFLLTPLLNFYKIGDFYSAWIIVIGAILGTVGLVTRYMSYRALGAYYTRTLKRADNHKLVMNGIYKYVRHAGYLSNILIFIGIGMTLCNFITLGFVILIYPSVYIYRINVEEKMLIDIFGNEYMTYRKKSKKLIPFIY